MTCLVVVEHDKGLLNPVTRNLVSAAMQIGGEVHLLVAGSGCAEVANSAAKIAGVAKVLLADAPYYADRSAENIAALVVAQAAGDSPRYSHVLAAATSVGKSFMPRVAAMLDVAQISEIVGVVSPDTFVRPIYAGSVLATVQSAEALKVITVRGTSFIAAEESASAPIELVAAPPDCGQSRLVSRDLIESARPELTTAAVVVSGGRGLANSEGFKQMLEPLADKLGAAIGASRAAVDAGYVANDAQVGQTGKVVAPQLYIAVGISGAIQHLAGMKDSRVIVAINKDPDAPIFQAADYGLVGDLFDLVPKLIAAL